jgi:chloramphenicol 3-O phosphotransferase
VADSAPGQIIVLNGAPRAGKSTIVRTVQATFDGPWLNVGVDVHMQATPERYQPGIGLRPGGERPDLEPLVVAMYLALYDSIAAHARLGLNVIVDVGHHDVYSTPRRILPAVAARLTGLPALFVGVRCPTGEIMRRRGDVGGAVPEPVHRWQAAVHDPGIYDVEVDTSLMSAEECAAVIRDRLRDQRPTSAFARLAVAP